MLEGQHTLITGAGSGIGRATALAAEAAGAEHLVLIDNDLTALKETMTGATLNCDGGYGI